MSLFENFISLIYPKICLSCENVLYNNEQIICTLCLYNLPKNNFHLENNNPIEHLFWGKTKIEAAAAFLNFNKESKVQHLLHQLKYKGKKEIGFFIGKLYGIELKKSERYKNINVIIPVPLHKKKLKKRGYNQSEFFAQGLANSMGVDVDINTLYRKKYSETQTKKSRYKRWENVMEIFQIKHNNNLEGKHILLVDDVITTGSTIEACANILLKIPSIKISVVSIAYAVN